MRRLPVLLALLTFLFPACASAQGVLIVTDPDQAVPLPRPIPPPFPIPRPQPPAPSYRVKELSVQANVRGQVAEVQVSQAFVNTGPATMEVQFCFPLPYDGAVSELTLLVDGQEFPARLLPADEARALYESIVRKNRDPALLEWIGSGMFRTSVFPVPPGQERKVSLKYTQLLRQSQQLTDFLFPLSTARYTSQPVESVQFRVAIEAPADLKSVYSPTHAVEVERPDARHAVVKYSASQVVPDSDFRLFYDVAEGPVGASVLSYRPAADQEGYFLLLASPQVRRIDQQPAAKNIVFVLDRSGSMEGQKIEQARSALTYVLNNLREGDRFNIVAYDSDVESFRPELQAFAPETRAAAVGFVNGIYAGGGTNIAAALQAGLSQFLGAEGPCYLMFLTDGLPTVGETNESKLVAASKQANPGRVRVISFGVGYDVNSRLLDRLSREHFGQSEYVRPEENLEVHVRRLYQKISSPVLTEVTVDIAFDSPPDAEQGPAVSRMYPAAVYDLFAGEQLVLVGRYRAAGAAKITIAGTLGGERQSCDFPAQFAAATQDASLSFVEKLWAMRRIGEIIDELDLHGKNDELVRELVALSTKHGIITPYTSFLADETSRELAAGERLQRASESLVELEHSAGRGGFRQRELKRILRSAGVDGAALSLPGDTALGVPVRELRDLKTDAPIAVEGLRIVGKDALYRRGNLWVTADTQDLDPQRDRGRITVIERFSPEYFALVEANTPEENLLLSRQQAGEQLLVSLRGQAYLIE